MTKCPGVFDRRKGGETTLLAARNILKGPVSTPDRRGGFTRRCGGKTVLKPGANVRTFRAGTSCPVAAVILTLRVSVPIDHSYMPECVLLGWLKPLPEQSYLPTSHARASHSPSTEQLESLRHQLKIGERRRGRRKAILVLPEREGQFQSLLPVAGPLREHRRSTVSRESKSMVAVQNTY
ncbi:hypothetical protein C8F04DRAFT_1139810, partial [Mycena alexandri]